MVNSDEETGRSASTGSITNRSDARTITLTIPAPRGLIMDRNGEPLAQSRVRHELSINFPQLSDESEQAVLGWARPRLAKAAELSDKVREISDEALLSHYKHRRWIPLSISADMSPAAADKIRSEVDDGLELNALYIRWYPQKSVAAHIIGHVRSLGHLPTGPLNHGDPLWEQTEGKAGLEKIFDKQLRGVDGERRLLFDSDGTKLLDEIVRVPQAGQSLITTLDLSMQKRAEQVLKDGCDRGAFVLIDVHTGELLAMASRPTFDLNVYIPRISTEDFAKLRDDPSKPLFARAFQAAYPPASTFKPIVAIEALNNNVIKEGTTYHCPAFIRIGGATFNNWSKVPEGDISVKRAIARSNNPWFYQVGIDVGADEFLSLARRLGYGRKSGLPLVAETSGLVPTDEWMTNNHGRHITHGDTAQLAIGQGVMLASPLQVAQGMAGIANGEALPQLHLVRQLQDINGRVVMASRPTVAEELKVSKESVEISRKGMSDVVNASWGTGKKAAIKYKSIAGKTGTAQWGPKSQEQRLAWFAGYMPATEPRFAYAVVYEGKPFETLSGGRKAAPIVRRFFNSLRSEIDDLLAPPPVAESISEEELLKELGLAPETEESEAPETVPEAEVIDDAIVAEPVSEEELEALQNGAIPAEPVQLEPDEPGAGED